MRRAAPFLALTFSVVASAQALVGCVVRPVSGETAALRAAPSVGAPRLAALKRGRLLALDDLGPDEAAAPGWTRVLVPRGGACCADLSGARAGWMRQADLDDCG